MQSAKVKITFPYGFDKATSSILFCILIALQKGLKMG